VIAVNQDRVFNGKLLQVVNSDIQTYLKTKRSIKGQMNEQNILWMDTGTIVIIINDKYILCVGKLYKL
jgi:hypothetical protein